MVQIGAVRLDAGDGFSEVGAFERLVRPRINPHLSDYFVALTAITNDRLRGDSGPLAPALAALAAFADGAPLWSNGNDAAVIEENCGLIAIANPLPPARWRNIAPALQPVIGGDNIRSAAIPAALGLAAPGQAHDALADARAIAAGLRHLRARGKI